MAEQIVQLNEENFEQEIGRSGALILVDFWAAWCGPCLLVAPVLEELAGEYGARIRIGKVNVDENMALAAKFGVQSIPTLLLFKAGQVVGQRIGAVPKHDLKKLIDDHI